MIRTDAEWLRRLADLVEAGDVEVGRVEPKNCGVVLGTFKPGTFAAKESPQVVTEMDQWKPFTKGEVAELTRDMKRRQRIR